MLEIPSTEENQMKFQMGAEVLTHLTKKTSTAGEDLGQLVRELAQAAEPLENKFNGAGRAAFDKFKVNSEQIAVELNQALGGVLQGISGMDLSFLQGDDEIATETTQAEGTVSYDAARFGGAR